MSTLEKYIAGSIPLGEASAFFLKLKYGSAGRRDETAEMLHAYAHLPAEAQQEILKEAGVKVLDPHSAQAIEDMKKTDSFGRSSGAQEADGKYEAGIKTSAAKLSYAERMLPGTEHYHSDRMRSMLENLPAKVYTPEGVHQTSLLRHEKVASAFKLALEQPDIKSYLAQEQEGMQAQEQNEVGFLRQRMQQMQTQQQTSDQGQAATAQQMATLQQQIDASQTQIAAAQQSAVEAQSMASQAQQAQLSSGDEALRNAQLAAQMRMAYQQLRGQMMDIASQDPAAGLAEQLKGMMPGTPGIGAEAASPGQPPGAAGGGAPADPASAGGEPPTQGAPTKETGPAGQAANAQAAPGAAPAEGETDANNAKSDGNASDKKDSSKPALQIGIKQAADSRMLGALGGAVMGAAGTRMMDIGGSEGLKSKVKKLESQEGGGFMQALNLAQSKTRLALSEASEKHPTATTLAGSLLGAGIGAGAGPDIANLLKR